MAIVNFEENSPLTAKDFVMNEKEAQSMSEFFNELNENVNAMEGDTSKEESAKAEIENLKAQIKGMVSSERPNTVNDTPSEEKCMFGFRK